MKRTGMKVVLLAVCFLTVLSAFGDSGKVKSKGVITMRNGSTLTVKTPDGDYTVTISGDTQIKQPVGLIGARKKDMPPEDLMPGLKISFEGTGDMSNVAAAKIQFDSDDLALAEVIQAGLNPTMVEQAKHAEELKEHGQSIATNASDIEAANKQIAETNARIDQQKQALNEVASQTKQRFSDLGDYVQKANYVAHFDVAKYVISDEDKQALAGLAADAIKLNGYIISVRGYADSQGTDADNQILSKQRAQAVVAYLLQDCHVPVGRIASPGAMSEAHPKASNETADGRAENRRVDVLVLQNKGIAGM
jgi:OmpA-OmpF porin, OOP family